MGLTEINKNNQIQINIVEGTKDISTLKKNNYSNEDKKIIIEENKSMNNSNEAAIQLSRTKFILVMISLSKYFK